MEAQLFYRESLTETFGRYARRLFVTSPAILFKLLFLRTYGKSRKSTLTKQSSAAGGRVVHQPQQSI